MRHIVILLVAMASACASSEPDPVFGEVDRATAPTFTTVGRDDAGAHRSPSTTSDSNALAHEGSEESPDRVAVEVQANDVVGNISPHIRGVSGGVDERYLRDIGATVNSWGGNPASRYNYRLGDAWNAGADWEYRNGNYGSSGDVALEFSHTSDASGAAVRLAIPTLGWVASNNDNATCSFPTDDGGCSGGDGYNCANPGPIADPTTANVRSDPAAVSSWVAELIDAGLPIEYLAMDNEPELWGYNHYDVHPECTTYEQVLDTYVRYSTALKAVAPDAKLLGPVTCCWFDYWHTAPGTAEGRDVDFVTWFLDEMRRHDEGTGDRSLDMLDVHYYPQSEVYNDAVDAETAARRLRSTRSLWDRAYLDESWIDTTIAFIPRMREAIDAAYPGTGLAISEWNFGADTSMNGALAIADVLGIYGREGVELASYWQFPPEGSPGYFAFKMHGNYDGQGSSFGGQAVSVETADEELLSAYAAVDRNDGRFRLLLVNKDPRAITMAPVSISGINTESAGLLYRYSSTSPGEIIRGDVSAIDSSFTVRLPASSITLIELRLTRDVHTR